MGFEITKRGQGRFNPVKNPLHFTGIRKDYLIHTVENNGGLIRVKLSGDITAQVNAGDIIWLKSDNDIYNLACTVGSRSFASGDTTINFLEAFKGNATTGYINLITNRASYRVEVQIVDFALNNLIENLAYSPKKDGTIDMDLGVVRNLLSYDMNSTFTSPISIDNYPARGFSLILTEKWVGSNNASIYDTANRTFGILAKLPLGESFQNYYLIHPTDAMKADITLSSSQVLNANTTPPDIIAAPGAGKIIVPISFTISIDFNTAAYATNTNFRFEINGEDVSGTISGVLNTTVDRVANKFPVDMNITTDLINYPLKFKVLTGNPTGGNSQVRVTVIYQVHDFTFAP